MTALILSTFNTHDGTTKARIKTQAGDHLVVTVPVGASEGQRLRLVDGVWRLQARAA